MIVTIWQENERLTSWIEDSPPRIGETVQLPSGMRYKVFDVVWWRTDEGEEIRCDVQVRKERGVVMRSGSEGQ